MTREDEKQECADSLSRRDFLKSTAVGAAGAAGAAMLGAAACSPFAEAGHSPEANESLPSGRSKVVLVRDEGAFDKDGRLVEEKIEEMLGLAMLELSGETGVTAAWSRYFQPDDTVGVKINVMMTPTSSELARPVVRGLMSAGVPEDRVILWDRDSAGYGLSGATERGKHFGFDSKSLSKIVTDEATALVNMPGMKVHWLAGVAVALKNWVGALANINVTDVGAAYKIHGDSCAECAAIPAIPAIRNKSRLIVVDALRPLFHGGPQVNPRYLWPYSALLVGTDPVAIDTACIKILEAKRREFHGADWPIFPPPKHVQVAEQKYRLGHAQMENIDLVKLGWQEGALV
jgi:hypothetical protein